MHRYSFDPSKDYAQLLDKNDSLACFRDEFYVEDGYIYLDGNSLGLLSQRAEDSLLEALAGWKRYAIDGWSSGEHPWFYMAERLGDMLSPLIGARPDEVVITNSTTVNLHQLVATFFSPTGKRTKIIADELDFPSDIYALASQLRLHGLDPEKHLVRVPSRNGHTIEEDDVIAAMGGDTALVMLPTVLYRSGQLLDIERLTKEAHARNIPIGFDASHSVGAVPHHFSDWDVDFAFWCNYKYLNSGPGSAGSLYVNRKHFGLLPGLAGWFSSNKEKQFEMSHELTPAQTAGAYQIGTPHILSMAPLLGSLELFAEAGLEALRAKSLLLTRYFMDLVNNGCADMGFSFGNPTDDAHRGGHVSLIHEEASRICKSLKEYNIVPDFRTPNVIRISPAAFYTSFEDIWDTVQIVKTIMRDKHYEKFEKAREVAA